MLKLLVAADCGIVAGQLLGPDGLPDVLVGGFEGSVSSSPDRLVKLLDSASTVFELNFLFLLNFSFWIEPSLTRITLKCRGWLKIEGRGDSNSSL